MNILLLEDEQNDAELIRKTLQRSGIDFQLSLVTDKEEFIHAIEHSVFDVILSDNSLPQFNAVMALRCANERGLTTPFILVTGTTSDEFAVEIMKEGASDYILKDRLHRLPSAILMSTNNHRIKVERARHLQEVIKSEALMKAAERLAKFGSWEVDRKKNSYHWSDEYYNILDYSIGEVPASAASFFLRVHPDDLSYVKQTLDIVMARMDSHGFDCRVVLRDGRIRHLYNKIHLLRDEEHKVVRINGFAMDITETRQAEEQLKKTELSYKRVVDNIIDGLIIDDVNGKIVYANEQFLKMFGFSKDDLRQMTIEDYVAPEYRVALIEQHQRRILGERVPDTFEFVGLRGDGERRWIEVRVSKVVENGKIIGTQSALRDITNARNAEEMRQQSEANLRAIFNNIDIGFVLIDSGFRIIAFNPYANRIAFDVLERKFTTGKLLISYFNPEARELVSASIQQAMDAKKVNYEADFVLPDGSLRWYSIGYHPILGVQNDTIGVLFTMREITSRKSLERQGQKIKDDLMRRNNDLEQFAYIISHNLRAPVASILGLTNIIMEEGLDVDEQVEAISNLGKTAHKLDEIIKDINKILSINKDISENKEEINFSDITETIVQILQNNFNSVQFEVNADYQELENIYSIKSYIHSIFINLISNSIKYKKSDVIPIINIRSSRVADRVRLLFSDNGIGIDIARNEKKLFGLYNRFHSHVEGKGMGLFMVKTQVELLGGSISISSRVNEGTQFMIELPVL